MILVVRNSYKLGTPFFCSSTHWRHQNWAISFLQRSSRSCYMLKCWKFNSKGGSACLKANSTSSAQEDEVWVKKWPWFYEYSALVNQILNLTLSFFCGSICIQTKEDAQVSGGLGRESKAVEAGRNRRWTSSYRWRIWSWNVLQAGEIISYNW